MCAGDPNTEEPQTLSDQEGVREGDPIRCLGGPRHMKWILDPNKADWVWCHHIYWRTKLTIYNHGVPHEEWCYLYFGHEDYLSIEGSVLNYPPRED